VFYSTGRGTCSDGAGCALTHPCAPHSQVLADARANSRRSSATDGDIKDAVTVTVYDAQRQAAGQKTGSQL